MTNPVQFAEQLGVHLDEWQRGIIAALYPPSTRPAHPAEQRCPADGVFAGVPGHAMWARWGRPCPGCGAAV